MRCPNCGSDIFRTHDNEFICENQGKIHTLLIADNDTVLDMGSSNIQDSEVTCANCGKVYKI